MSRLILNAGDTLFMPEGMEHAVYTPVGQNTLCVGGFGLTPAHVRDSIRVLRHQQQHDKLTNDDPPEQMFKAYETHLATLRNSSRKELEDLVLELKGFIEQTPPTLKDYQDDSQGDDDNEPTEAQKKWINEWARFKDAVENKWLGLLQQMIQKLPSNSRLKP